MEIGPEDEQRRSQPDESRPTTVKRFDSRENPVTAARPLLVVRYLAGDDDEDDDDETDDDGPRRSRVPRRR